jgi:hypothetical protein
LLFIVICNGPPDWIRTSDRSLVFSLLFANGGRGFADGNVMGAFSSGTDEGTRVDFRIALGGVANRSAARYLVEGTTVGRSARPVHADRSPNDWRFLLSRK